VLQEKLLKVTASLKGRVFMTDTIIPAAPDDHSDISSVVYPDLKSLREAKGLSLKDIYESTRISMANLRAIEGGQFPLLPSPAYTRTFIRSYARAIGAESDIVLAAYENYLQSLPAPPREKETPDAWRKGGRYGKWIIWLLCAVIAVVAIVILLSRDNQPSPEATPAPPAASAPASPAPPVQTETASAAPAPTSPAPPVQTETASAAPTPTSPAPHLQTAPAAPAPTPTPPETRPEVRPEAPKPVSEKKYHLFMEAREPVWLRIRGDENRSEQMILSAGQTLERTADEPFTVDIGNAGGIAITFQGKPAGSVGKRGQVVHLRFPQD
jgi:cytoskeleton protein RodZ